MSDSSIALNPKQMEAVEWCDGPELVLAGAGSGKTRVIAAKIAHLIDKKSVPPYRILALTFTNKAAREMQERVRSLVGENLRGMQVSTFHSYGLRFLYRNAHLLQEMGYPKSFVVFDRGDVRNLVKRVAKELSLDAGASDVSFLVEKISRAKTGCDPATLAPDIEERWASLYEKYGSELLRQGALDFDDLMMLPLHILTADREAMERERASLEWILVDEYQDVNTPQYLLLRLLSGGSGRLMVVGDPDQSIYGWRGADMSLIMRFEDDFPGGRVVVLDQNYRSTGNILDAANAIIKHNPERREKNLWTASVRGAKIHALLARNDDEETGFIADEIERLADEGYEYGEMTILYRMNALSRGYEQMLLERGIPYRIVRGVSFYERREVKDVLSMMRLAVNPKDEAALERIANVPKRGLGKKSAADLANFLAIAKDAPEDIWARMTTDPPLKGAAANGASELASLMEGILNAGTMGGAIDFIMYNCAYEEYLREAFPDDWEERSENIRELISVMPEGDVAEALAQVALFTDQDSGDLVSSVNLLTMHAAKGLEFPVVFLAGFEEGIFPSGRSFDSQGGVEEERRLCYVGMTRARERLYITGVMSRLIFGSFQRSPFSRFIFELPDDNVTVDDRTRGVKSGDVRGGGHGRRWSW
ncbi:MAG: UvrD-helicase domain-containing protein [Synergistaceae bacterium]|jgi:DNA helicase-2/ATP-dependent DNA helicase PcrA|nr:UvrD-helicase domain-containing protein [Synergistaceae bacterium]